MWRKILLVLITGAIVVPLIMICSSFSGVRQVAHESVQLHLHLIGSSMYEYHSKTGQWPTQKGDLAKTTLPAKSPYWEQLLDEEVNLVVWHKSLKPDPKENAGQILAYHNKGLIASGGRTWVCWGDLRTEYIKTEDLREYLKNLKD